MFSARGIRLYFRVTDSQTWKSTLVFSPTKAWCLAFTYMSRYTKRALISQIGSLMVSVQVIFELAILLARRLRGLWVFPILEWRNALTIANNARGASLEEVKQPLTLMRRIQSEAGSAVLYLLSRAPRIEVLISNPALTSLDESEPDFFGKDRISYPSVIHRKSPSRPYTPWNCLLDVDLEYMRPHAAFFI